LINLGSSVDCGAFVSEKFSRHFAPKGFSAESIVIPDPGAAVERVPVPSQLPDQALAGQSELPRPFPRSSILSPTI